MPSYFFHRFDDDLDPDIEGTHCADLHAARREAILYAAGFMKDHPEQLLGGSNTIIEVTDAKGAIVTMITISAIDAPSMPTVLKQRRG